jgi:dipeptidyl-peptidase-4
MAQNNKNLIVEDIFTLDEFEQTRFTRKVVHDVEWLKSDKGFTYLVPNQDSKLYDLYHYDISSGEKKLLLEGSSLLFEGKPIEMRTHEWSKDENYLLLTGKLKRIWRHSRQSKVYVLDRKTGEMKSLAEKNSRVQNPKFSADGNMVGYTLDNNLYVVDLISGVSKALTTDGNADILNGIFDWVYEEEFGTADAWKWSPDGKKIAFWRSDQTHIKSFNYLLDQLPLYNEVHMVKYPKVGTKNSIVKIGVVNVNDGSTTWMDIGDEEDIYIPRIKWTKDPNLLSITRLNRKQNKMELLLADVTTGKTNLVVTDKSEAWIDVTDDLYFLKNKNRFIWTSEKSGFRHIYLYNFDGTELKQLTSGRWEVSKIVKLDNKNGWVFFEGKKESPLENHIYRVKLDGSKLEKISIEPGWHNAKLSKEFKYYLDFYSDIYTPPQVNLYKSDGKTIRVVDASTISGLSDYKLNYPEFLSVKTTDGVELNASIIKPADFDPNRKYPVIVYGYGGPGSQRVTNSWQGDRGLWHQMMAGKGFVIFSIDNRGTGGRGADFKHLAYEDISKWVVRDQIEGAKYLASLPYVDASRIGVWGWSGGGYLTCNLLTRGADYFKTGVAVAPVSDFKNYDTIWTERYMGLLGENSEGYENANVLKYAHLLKGKLMLVHGSGDDNVHMQNSIQLAEKLIELNIPVDLMIYPNKDHRIFGRNNQNHLFNKMTEYFLKNL